MRAALCQIRVESKRDGGEQEVTRQRCTEEKEGF